MAVLSYLLLDKKIKLRYLVLTVAGLGAAYLFLSVARNHDVTYLNGIFEMKNPDLPIFISQPYMYVAMNYENFNYLVVNLIEHSFGMRQIYPFIALTGAKFLIPGLGAEFPLYLRKEELSTLTLIYDAYYDFHLLGVVGFGLLFGIVCQKTADGLKKKVNPVAALFYVQFAMYALLSFFTSWFSVATTWFWLFLTAVFYVVMSGRKPEIKKQTIVRICAALAGILLCTGLVRAHVFAGKPAKGEFSFGLQFYTDRRTGKGAGSDGLVERRRKWKVFSVPAIRCESGASRSAVNRCGADCSGWRNRLE